MNDAHCPVAYWDKAVGGFYIAGSSIPEHIKARLTPLYQYPDWCPECHARDSTPENIAFNPNFIVEI